MGGGTYSSITRSGRAAMKGYATKSNREIFQSRNIQASMDPKAATIRESRDSQEHPESLAIIIGLDVTGSMGAVPQMLIRDGLPKFVGRLQQVGVAHPQIMFVAVGDHEYDHAPLQVGQFESSDEMLDHWLTSVWLEGGGGGNNGESYQCAWHFAATRTEIDCLEKRGQRGILITIGDEPCLPVLPGSAIHKYLGGQHENYTSMELLAAASEKYHVAHINIRNTGLGRFPGVEKSWKHFQGIEFISVSDANEVPTAMTDIVLRALENNGSVSPSTIRVSHSEEEARASINEHLQPNEEDEEML